MRQETGTILSDTQMTEAFKAAGHEVPEAATKRVRRIAEECWAAAAYVPRRRQGGGPKGHDPVKVMQLFEARVREDADLVLAVIGERYWHNLVRTFLEHQTNSVRGWRHGDAFRRAMKALEAEREAKRSIEYKARREAVDSDWALQTKELSKASSREAYQRKVRGIKRIYADYDTRTGQVKLIDKEYGPFRHIKINERPLPEVTTEEALAWCDGRVADVKFIRALCHLIPDPRKPIGEQWTPEIIREAKDAAAGLRTPSTKTRPRRG